MISSIHPIPSYRPRDTLALTINSITTFGGIGLAVSAAQNALTKHQAGAFGVFTRTGSTIATFAAIGGTYTFFKAATCNIRRNEDGWNSFFGGFPAGMVAGLRSRSLPAVLIWGAAVATTMGVVDWAGGIAGIRNFDSGSGGQDSSERLKWMKNLFSNDRQSSLIETK